MFASGPSPDDLAVGDFNRDTHLDLAISNFGGEVGGGTVTVLLGDGAGNFSPAGGSPIQLGRTANPNGLVAADFNQDGQTDLAIVNRRGNDVIVLLGDGTGSFTADPDGPYA